MKATALRRTLRATEVLSGVAATIAAAEWIVVSDMARPGGVHDWRITRTRMPVFRGRAGSVLTPVFDERGVRVMSVLRTGAGLVSIVSPVAGSRKWANLASTALGYLMSLRTFYGNDGAEQMSMLSGFTTTIASWSRSTQIQRDALRFLAAQAALSYSAAGFAKVVSPVWRNGDAVRDIMRTRVYGSQPFYRLLYRYPILARTSAWATIAFEVGFPTVFLLPQRARRSVLLIGIVFHAANASAMGLNRFFWSFVSTYPAIDYVAGEALERRSR